MTNCTNAQRRRLSALAAIAMLFISWSISAHAQSSEHTLILRPHCEATDQSLCPEFNVADPSTLTTTPLSIGDTLDLDVVLVNPTHEKIGKIRLWISYDTDALEGTALSVSKAFPTITPGQANFSSSSGYAKITASASSGNEPTDAIMPVARLTFVVKNAMNAASSPLSFHDQRAGIDGHTFVTTTTAPTQNLLSTPLGSLLVQLVPSISAEQGYSSASTSNAYDSSAAASEALSASSVSSISSSDALPAPLVAPESPNSFGLIQVQNVRIGTKDNALYVTWDALSHPKLQGYNVYYGSLRGRYLHRRSVSVASRGAMISNLPTGKTYYAAIRGVDDENLETAFSAEVSVEIGNPSTSSSPIIGALDLVAEIAPSVGAPDNPVENMDRMLADGSTAAVPGRSGAPSGVFLLLIGSAAIGTLLACRRQMTVSKKLPV